MASNSYIKAFWELDPPTYAKYEMGDDKQIQDNSKSHWSVFFSENIEKLETLKELFFLNNSGSSSTIPTLEPKQIIDLNDEQKVEFIKNKNNLLKEGKVISMDQGGISKVPCGDMLYSEQHGPCIGVLMRAMDGNKIPSHVGIVHVFSKGGILKLKNEIDAITKLAKDKIEIFIAGGNRSNIDNYFAIREIVAQHENIEIKDDLFALCEPFSGSGLYQLLYQYSDLFYQGSVGVKDMGFDKFFNP